MHNFSFAVAYESTSEKYQQEMIMSMKVTFTWLENVHLLFLFILLILLIQGFTGSAWKKNKDEDGTCSFVP